MRDKQHIQTLGRAGNPPLYLSLALPGYLKREKTMKQTKKTVTPLAVMNHYKLMYSAGKIAKDGAAHKRMHQLFDDVCTEEKAVKRAKIQIKQHEIA